MQTGVADSEIFRTGSRVTPDSVPWGSFRDWGYTGVMRGRRLQNFLCVWGEGFKVPPTDIVVTLNIGA